MSKWIIKDVMVFCDFQIIFEVSYVFWILHDKREAEPSTHPTLLKKKLLVILSTYIRPLAVVPSADSIIWQKP